MPDSKQHKEALEVFLEASKIADALESDNRETQSARDNLNKANSEMTKAKENLEEIKKQRNT